MNYGGKRQTFQIEEFRILCIDISLVRGQSLIALRMGWSQRLAAKE